MKTLEQKTVERGEIRLLLEKFEIALRTLAFIAPLVFGFIFYSNNELLKAIFWAILATIGFKLYHKSV